MSSTKPSNIVVLDKATQRLQALKNYVKNAKTEISINGDSHKLSEVIAIYQASLDTRAAVSTKRAEAKAAMSSRATAEAARRQADRALKPWVINQFGAESQEAIDFGFPPPKVAVRSVENKTNAVALAQATRAARHTMGKRQKQDVRGTLSVPTAPAAPANTVQPATPGVVTPNQAAVAQAPPPQATLKAPVATVVAPVANGASPVPSGSAPIATGTAPQSNGTAAS